MEHDHLEPNLHTKHGFPKQQGMPNIDFQDVWFIDFLILIIDFQTDSLIDLDQSKALFLTEKLISKINFSNLFFQAKNQLIDCNQ